MKDPTIMSAAAINNEMARLDAKRSELNHELIAAGRGYETAEETYRLSDPLALRWREIADRQAALRREVERRCGPGHVGRLPRGVGPIRQA